MAVGLLIHRARVESVSENLGQVGLIHKLKLSGCEPDITFSLEKQC